MADKDDDRFNNAYAYVRDRVRDQLARTAAQQALALQEVVQDTATQAVEQTQNTYNQLVTWQQRREERRQREQYLREGLLRFPASTERGYRNRVIFANLAELEVLAQGRQFELDELLQEAENLERETRADQAYYEERLQDRERLGHGPIGEDFVVGQQTRQNLPVVLYRKKWEDIGKRYCYIQKPNKFARKNARGKTVWPLRQRRYGQKRVRSTPSAIC